MQMHLPTGNRAPVAFLLVSASVLAVLTLATSRLTSAHSDLRAPSGNAGEAVIIASSGVTQTIYLPLVVKSQANVQITFIDYDPVVTLDEYVKLDNQGGLVATMTNWTLCDLANNCYTFPAFTLDVGASVNVWTKVGSDTTTDLYWGRSVAVWNNTGDTAYLRDQYGKLISQFTYLLP